MEAALTIGRAAKAANVGVETIRFYERQELIERPARRGSGPRRHSPQVVERIRFIRGAQRLGFALREVRELLALEADPGADCSDVRAHAAAKLVEVRTKVEQLQRIAGALEMLVAECPARGPVKRCTILGALASSIDQGDRGFSAGDE